jgi:Lrp/AsnC family transcriptional regulator, leucine-responsive regulatory protein
LIDAMPESGTAGGRTRELGKGLDSLDIRLLDCLQSNNLLTADQLAERVGRSPSAIARRLRRLRKTGVIAADVALVSDDAAGNPLFMLVQVQLERHALPDVAALRRRLVACDNVQLLLDVSGSIDIVLLVVARDLDAFNQFADEMLASDRSVRRYETMLVKNRRKTSLAIPLEAMLGE